MALEYTSGRNTGIDSDLDIPVKSMLIMHDPDGRDLDIEMLLRVIETIMHQATQSQVSVQQQDVFDVSNIMDESLDSLGNSIHNISSEILCKAYGDENVHESTLSVLYLLGSYRWDAKLLLALSAFAIVIGEFCVLEQSQTQNPLAASIALLKQVPRKIGIFEPVFTSLASLVKHMVEVTRSVSQFEGLPITYLELQDDTITSTKSLIYAASYWITRSIMVGISLISNMRGLGDEQVHLLSFQEPYSISTIVWEIASLKSKISGFGTQLRPLVDACQLQIDQKMHRKLNKVFEEPQSDNQEVLWMLFGLRNDLPLRQSSEPPQVSVSVLKNKTVILLISKPELLPVNELFLLVQQTYDHPLHKAVQQSYGILWVPFSSSDKWSNAEVTIFNLLSNSLPWYSIRQPWLLSSTTINYAKKEWGYKEKPIMVVIDPMGQVVNTNAVDMVRIWGCQAFPFSASREEELWRNERWNLRLLLDGSDPLLNMWVEEEKTICIYGSNRFEWVKGFSEEIKEIQSLAVQLEVVYVGNKDQSTLASHIVSAIERENLSHSLSATKIPLFWERLESIRRSKLRLEQTTHSDHILREVETLLDTSKDRDWMIFGKGGSSNIVVLQGEEWTKFLSEVTIWKKYIAKIGLVDAIKLSLEPSLTEPCIHSTITAYNRELLEETVFCEKCKRPMEKYIIYDVMH